MKRRVGVLFTTLILLITFTGTSFASLARLSVSEPYPQSLHIGDTFGLDVLIDSVYNLQGLEFKLSYDPTIVEPVNLSNTVSYDPGFDRAGMLSLINKVYEEKVWSVTAWIYSDLPQGQTFINPSKVGKVNFKLLKVGLVNFDFAFSDMKKNIFYANPLPDTEDINHETLGLPVYFLSGVVISPGAASGVIMGKVTLTGRSNHGGATVVLEGTPYTTVTDNLGNYYFDNIPAGTYTIRVRSPKYLSVINNSVQVQNRQITTVNLTPIAGDAKADAGNVIDIYDLTVVAAAFNGRPGADNWNINADINLDNVIDIYDLVLVSTNFGKSGQ